PGIPGDARKSYIDSFTYTLVKLQGEGKAEGPKSNLAEVEIQVFTQDPQVVPVKPPQPPTFFGTKDYKIPLMVAVGLCLILATIVAIVSVFLYKKRYGASDMIGTFPFLLSNILLFFRFCFFLSFFFL